MRCEKKLAYYFAATLVVLTCYSCKQDSWIKEKFQTRESDRCNIKITRDQYAHDSAMLHTEFRAYLDKKVGPYSAPIYGKATEIFLDTILFSPDFKHASLLIIEKSFSEYSNRWEYDGGVHFSAKAQVNNDSVKWEIYTRHGARHIAADSYTQMSELLRYKNFVARSYESKNSTSPSYNLDDCRFWTSAYFKKVMSSEFVLLR